MDISTTPPIGSVTCSKPARVSVRSTAVTEAAPSMGAVLDRNRGIGPGFHAMRLILASVVLWVHSIPIVLGESAIASSQEHFWSAPVNFVLPAFFSLGGFLVLGSAFRTTTLGSFLALRALRLFPALIVETILSAVLMGALVSTLSGDDYFTNAEFFSYFGNIIGRIQLTLPGVFEQSASLTVNGSLWTIPGELLGYIIVAISLYTGLMYNKRAVAVLSIAYLLFNIYADHKFPRPSTSAYSARLLVLGFVAGCAIYVWRHRIPHSLVCFVTALILALVGTRIDTGLDSITVVLMAYCTVYLGLVKFGTSIPWLSSADLSYGIYLYGFPVQQWVQYEFPDNDSWFVNIVISMPIVVGLAALSWLAIEKPALSLRHKVIARAKRHGTSRPSLVVVFCTIFSLIAYGAYMCTTGWVVPVKLPQILLSQSNTIVTLTTLVSITCACVVIRLVTKGGIKFERQYGFRFARVLAVRRK